MIQFLKRWLRWLFVYQAPDNAVKPQQRLCPVSGCTIPIRRDYPFCSMHTDLLPFPLYRALRQAAREHGHDSPAYCAALAHATAAIERQLQPPDGRP